MTSHKKTKIIATIGPVSQDPDILETIMAGGADCIRLNFSHGNHVERAEKIVNIRKIDKKLRKHTAIIADIQGPKMRVGIMPKDGLLLHDGATIILDCGIKEYVGGAIPVPSKMFMEGTKENSRVFLDDGILIIQMISKKGAQFQAQVIKGGLLFSNKGINVPSLVIKGSVLSEKDKADIIFAKEHGADYIALSFLRNAADVIEAKEFINNPRINVIAKIERPEALVNIDQIIEASDAVMIARGDLGIETPLWELPIRQKEIVDKVRAKCKPVIVATQMLDSMIRNPLPPRAEVSDVANAVFDSADAVMLSGETASGKNPFGAVDMMRKVLESTEKIQRISNNEAPRESAVVAVASSAADIASKLNAKAIFVETLTGESAKIISHFRPKNIIVGLTDDQRAANQLALVWGVVPALIKTKSIKKIEDIIAPGIKALKGSLAKGDTIVCAYDSEFKLAGKATLNTITVKVL